LLGFDKYNFTAISGQKLFNQNNQGQDFMRMGNLEEQQCWNSWNRVKIYILAASLLNLLATPDTKS
jgi:hypothetical protein